MNDQELKDLWRAQKIADAPPIQIEAVRKKMADLHSVLDARNLREIVTAAVVILIFGFYYLAIPYPITRIGDLIVIAGCIFASWKMIESKQRAPRPDAAAPMAQWLQQERARVHHEAELLRTVTWWYTLPILLGANVFFWGFPSRGWAPRLVYTAVTILLGWFIAWLNQRARRKQLLPVQDELDALLIAEAAAPAAAAPKPNARGRFLAAGIILIIAFGLVGAAQLLDNRPAESPRQPAFADISAFDLQAHKDLDSWLDQELAHCQYPSLSVAIVQNGRVVYQRALGFENLKTYKMATEKTSYHVASVTKTFTALIAATLHARGVIDLDAPVAKYLPTNVVISTTPERGAKITLRQLASHTSGLPRGVPGAVQSVEGRYELEPARLYKHLRKMKLEYEPGAGQRYSNFAFGLLGHALERAAGKPYAQLLDELVCKPLGLERTALEELPTLSVATGYSSAIPRREVKHAYRERFAASGGLITTAADLAKFVSAQMKAPTHLGWSVGSLPSAGRFLEKNGGRENCSAWIGFNSTTAVVVLANAGGPDVDQIGRWLLERSIPRSTTNAPVAIFRK